MAAARDAGRPGHRRAVGRRPQRMPPPLAQRIAARIAALPATLTDVERAAAVAVIEAEEQQRERTLRRPVAGFDLTFSVPKSVSVLWALADADTQAVIHQAHRDAIDARARRGRNATSCSPAPAPAGGAGGRPRA